MGTANTISEAMIANLALVRIGSTQTITSLDDGSNEANACAILYPQARDILLCDFPLPWAESYAVLDQVAGPEIDGLVANAQWARSYRYPTDCLKLRRLVATPVQTAPGVPQTTGTFLIDGSSQPWKRGEGNPYPISYGVGHDDDGRLVLTDAVGDGAGVTAIYTAAVSDPTQFSADFVDALAWRLGADLAMSLALSDSKRQFAHQEYEKHARVMRANLMNEQQSDISAVRWQAETVRARWGG